MYLIRFYANRDDMTADNITNTLYSSAENLENFLNSPRIISALSGFNYACAKGYMKRINFVKDGAGYWHTMPYGWVQK